MSDGEQAEVAITNDNTKAVSLWRRLARATAVSGAVAFIAAIVALSIAALHMRAAAVPSPEPTPPLAVAAHPVELVPYYEVEDRYLGRLEAARQTSLAFERGGLVLQVLVEEGDEVAEGEVVAILDVVSLEARRAGLEAQRREAEAQLTLARLTTDRQQELTGMGYASEQRYDEARLDAEATSARIDAIAAEIETLDIDIAKSTIRAPFAGTIAARHIDEGAIITAGTAIVDLLETGRMLARIGLPPRMLPSVDEGEVYDLTINELKLPALLLSVRPDLRMQTRTVEAVFELQGDLVLPIGEVAELGLLRRVDANGAWLPLSALKENANGLWTVLTAIPSDDILEVAQEAVEVLHVADDMVFVRGTFRAGALIISEGTNRVVPGQQVVLAEAR